MTKSLFSRVPWRNGLMVLLASITLVTFASAQTVVAAPPWLKQQYFKSNGQPNAFGCVFTYVSGSSTPLATYTDYTGNTQNSNPIDLDSGGFAGTSGTGMFLQAGTAYRITLKTSGGSHCASGSTVWSMDGVGGGVTINTTNVTYSATPLFPIVAQNQLFKITLTGDAVAQPLTAVGILPPALVAFEITQDGTGGHSFTWPSNSVGGSAIGAGANQVSTQTFYWDGSNARPIGPLLAGQVPAVSSDLLNWLGDINAAGNATITGIVTGGTYRTGCTPRSTTGTFQLCKTDNILWRNNADSANQGISIDSSDRMVISAAGGLETSGTVPDIFLGNTSASFPRLKRNGTAVNFRLGDDSADAPITASTGGFSGPITSTSSTYAFRGPVVSDPGASAASTMSGYFKTGFGWCAEDSSSVVYCTTPVATSTTLRSFHFNSCTTGGSGDTDQCTDTASLPATQPDTNYDLVCTFDAGEAATGGSCPNGAGTNCYAAVNTYNKSTTNFGYSLAVTRGFVGAGAFGTVSCIVGHN